MATLKKIPLLDQYNGNISAKKNLNRAFLVK
jgi:hypothetical protein